MSLNAAQYLVKETSLVLYLNMNKIRKGLKYAICFKQCRQSIN